MRIAYGGLIIAAVLPNLVDSGPITACPISNLCVSLDVPQSTASSGQGDIYLQITAPTSYEYVSIGQGPHMAGSNMFVVYTSSDGQNVTVSPRLASGYYMPQHDNAAQITVLGGSGVSNGRMTANIKCSNCQSWSGGSMDFRSTSTSWVYATKGGTPLRTNDLNAAISMHDSAASFAWDISKSKGGSDINPFTSSPLTGGAAGSVISTCASGDGSGGGDGGSGDGNSGGNDKRSTNGCSPSGGAISSTSSASGFTGSSSSTLLVLHGALASAVFLCILPTGGILIRIAEFNGLLWVHSILQIIGLVAYTVACGLGIYLALQYSTLSTTHPLLGLVLLIGFIVQPIFGWLHHKKFKQTGRRTFSSHVHLWLGRMVIIIGIVNGGLGLQMRLYVTNTAIIAYAAVAVIAGVAYIASIIFGERRRHRKARGAQEKA